MTTSTQQLDVVTYPAPVLRKKAAPVSRVTPEILALIDSMAETMYAANGVGLAAPQVGISLRIIVVDAGHGLQALINPEIVSTEGSQTGVEGCLSLPDLHGEVTRAQRVVVRGINRRGKKVQYTGENLWARAMQHEIDHLDGILFTDHVIPESLIWATGETDEQGNYLERTTSLADALAIFERQHTFANE